MDFYGFVSASSLLANDCRPLTIERLASFLSNSKGLVATKNRRQVALLLESANNSHETKATNHPS